MDRDFYLCKPVGHYVRIRVHCPAPNMCTTKSAHTAHQPLLWPTASRHVHSENEAHMHCIWLPVKAPFSSGRRPGWVRSSSQPTLQKPVARHTCCILSSLLEPTAEIKPSFFAFPHLFSASPPSVIPPNHCRLFYAIAFNQANNASILDYNLLMHLFLT